MIIQYTSTTFLNIENYNTINAILYTAISLDKEKRKTHKRFTIFMKIAFVLDVQVASLQYTSFISLKYWTI